MSNIINDNDLQLLSKIIDNYISPDNNIRNQSDKILLDLRQKNFGNLIIGFLKIVENNNFQYNTKLTSLVLLRKILELDSKNKWNLIENNLKENFKDLLLNIYIKEKNENLLNKIGNVIIELIHILTDFNENWEKFKELSLSLFKIDLNDNNLKNNYIYINSLIKLVTNSIGFLDENILNNFDEIFNFILKIFNLIDYYEIKINISIFINELFAYENKIDENKKNKLIFNILKISLDLFLKKNEFNLKKILKILIDLIDFIDFETINPFYNDIKNLIYNNILQYKNFSNEFNEEIKKLSFELLINLYEFDNFFDDKNFNEEIKNFIDYLFKFSIEYSQNDFLEINVWSNISNNYFNYKDVPVISEDNIRFIFNLIQRLNEKFNNQLQNILIELINNLLQSENNLYIYLGLLSLSQLICYLEKMDLIENIIPLLLNNLQNYNNNNNNLKIKFAVLYCIDELCINFNDDFIEKYNHILNILLNYLINENSIRIKCQIIITITDFIINYNKEENKKIFINYLNNIFENFFKIFLNSNDNQNDILKKQILINLTEIIEYFEETEYIKQYYKTSLEILIKFFNDTFINNIKKNLYSNLINLITIIGINEENILIPIIPNLIKCIINIIQNNNDTFNINYFQKEINSSLEKLIPYIINKYKNLLLDLTKTILEILKIFINEYKNIQINKQNKYNQINDLDNYELENNEEEKEKEENYEREFIIDFVNNLKLLNILIENAEQNYSNIYIENTENILVEIINTFNHSKVKIIITTIFSNIIKILYENNINDKNKGKKYINNILQFIEKENKIKNWINFMDNLNNICEKMIKNYEKNEIIELIDNLLKLFDLFEKERIYNIKQKNIKENELDEIIENKNDNSNSFSTQNREIELYNEKIEYSENSLDLLIENFENIFKYVNHNYLNDFINYLIFNKIPNLLNSENEFILLKNYPHNLKIISILICDFLENFEINYFNKETIENFLNILLKLIKNFKPEIRQASYYGLGLFFKKSDNINFKNINLKIFDEILNSIEKYENNIQINDENRKNILALDNAISALGKGIFYKNIYENKYLEIWINNLPIKFDESEMIENHEFLINNFQNLTKNNLNEEIIKKIFKVFIDIYKENKMSNEDIDNKIKYIFNNIINKNINYYNIIQFIYNNQSNDIMKNKIKSLL